MSQFKNYHQPSARKKPSWKKRIEDLVQRKTQLEEFLKSPLSSPNQNQRMAQQS